MLSERLREDGQTDLVELAEKWGVRKAEVDELVRRAGMLRNGGSFGWTSLTARKAMPAKLEGYCHTGHALVVC